jgi:hypothetical protein
MSQQYLLPCSCGQKLTVSPSQAGNQVACSCGKLLSVPTLRGLRELESAPSTAPAQVKTGWSPIHGTIFAGGLVVAAIGIVFLALHGLQYSQIMGFKLTEDFTPNVVSNEMSRIDALSPLQALEEWHENIEHGLGEQEEPPWSKYKRLADFNLTRIKLSAGALVVGIGLSIVTLLAAPKSRSAAA